MDKIIFLDIDGVLNSTSWCFQLRNKEFLGDIQSSFDKLNGHQYVDPTAVRLVQKLALQHGAKIVISSSWRRYDLKSTIDNLWNYKDIQGLIPLIIDQTPHILRKHLDVRRRGDEIQQWLDDHDYVKQYVIIDDDSDMLDSQKENFVQTNHNFGFTFYDYHDADMILNKEVS